MTRQMTALIFVAALAACGSPENGNKTSDETAQTIYFGGDIITMEGDEANTVEAVVESQGKIVFVGSKTEAFSNYGKGAEKYDLEGATMMPGFIEPHAHPVSIGAFLLPVLCIKGISS